jgi:peptide/nickel transport system substrate-binding protein
LEDIPKFLANPKMQVVSYPGYGKYWTLNYMKAPTNDVHVRRAIAYAFDYEQALALVYGYAKQANSLVFPSHWAYNPNGFMFHRNITRAREELAKSAYPEGGFTIKVIWCAGVDLQRKLNELLKTNLQELNINVEIDGKEWATFAQLQTKFETSYHMATFNMMMFLPDPHNDYVRFTPAMLGVSNYGWYNNTEVAALIEKAAAEVDIEKRKELYWEIQDIIHHQEVACLPIFYEDRFVVLGKWVHGFVGNTFLCETFGNPWFMWIEPNEKI